MPRIYGLTNQERSGDLEAEDRYQRQNCKFNIVHFGDQMMRDRPDDECVAEIFRKDIRYAEELVKSILEDGDPAELLIVLRQLALAFPHTR